MKGRLLHSAAALFLITGLVNGTEDDRRKRNEQALRSLRIRAEQLAPPAPGEPLNEFLAQETHRLLLRAKTLPIASVRLHKVLEALDDLLDARDRLAEVKQLRRLTNDKPVSRDDTAKRLERAYFRVQQADYFGRLSGDAHAAEYILRSRQLYQQARSGYDREDYAIAVKLASASTELVNVLENLAQAAARRHDPPVLK